MTYRTDPNEVASAGTFNVAWERLFYSLPDWHPTGAMRSVPLGRELLMFEGDADKIRRVQNIVSTHAPDLFEIPVAA